MLKKVACILLGKKPARSRALCPFALRLWHLDLAVMSSVWFGIVSEWEFGEERGPAPLLVSPNWLLPPVLPAVLFHMYDSDSDGRITLEEYRNVKCAPLAPPLPLLGPSWSPKVTKCPPHWQVVEELLSGNPHIEKESARSIADGAMMEAASVCVGQMVSAPSW